MYYLALMLLVVYPEYMKGKKKTVFIKQAQIQTFP